jgi:hypothetical protein
MKLLLKLLRRLLVNLPRRFHGLDKAWVWMVRALLAFLGIGLSGLEW